MAPKAAREALKPVWNKRGQGRYHLHSPVCHACGVSRRVSGLSRKATVFFFACALRDGMIYAVWGLSPFKGLNPFKLSGRLLLVDFEMEKYTELMRYEASFTKKASTGR
ncbi:MAG: hypothetical protein HZB82_01070 [Deltaproteobacteria bacterium]|nr:hypothetical protein [Deltaproteobacteria bacterium]